MLKIDRLLSRRKLAVIHADDDDPDDDAGTGWIDAALYCPPWRDVLADGTLGPPRGPVSKGAWDGVLDAYRASRAGGALWDADAAEGVGKLRRQAIEAQRHDQVEALAYLHAHGHELPKRELQAMTLFYGGASQGRIATVMDVSPSTIKEWLRRFRARLRR